MTVEEFEEKVGAHHKNVSGIPKIIPLTVVDGLGFDVKEVKEWLEPVVFEEDYYSRWLEQEMPAGIVAGVRMLVDIVTEQGPTIHARIEHRDFREGEEETIEWKVKGKPSMEIRVLRKDSHMASASSLFNRIPDVMEGDPGIVELWKYRPLRPSIFY